jgi:hypothetical protein
MAESRRGASGLSPPNGPPRLCDYCMANVGSLTQRLRGAGAIAGWAEWLIGVEVVPGEKRTRRVQFELKAGEPPEPFCYRVSGEEFDNWKRIERTDWVAEKSSQRSRAEDFVQ